MTSTPLLQLTDAHRHYEQGNMSVRALNGVDLTIQLGEFVAIMGPSGCGKSTLLRTIGLLDRLTSGQFLMHNKRIDNASERETALIRRDRIGFVFQDFKLVQRLSILQNVGLPLKYKKTSRRDRDELASQALDLVGLSDRVSHKPEELSGGQKHRAAIARAIITGPDLILADEPTGNLDEDSSKSILELFRQLNRTGRTIVMVTHSKTDSSYADRVLRMHDGRMI